jgi:hypothetical protein
MGKPFIPAYIAFCAVFCLLNLMWLDIWSKFEQFLCSGTARNAWSLMYLHLSSLNLFWREEIASEL